MGLKAELDGILFCDNHPKTRLQWSGFDAGYVTYSCPKCGHTIRSPYVIECDQPAVKVKQPVQPKLL